MGGDDPAVIMGLCCHRLPGFAGSVQQAFVFRSGHQHQVQCTYATHNQIMR